MSEIDARSHKYHKAAINAFRLNIQTADVYNHRLRILSDMLTRRLHFEGLTYLHHIEKLM